MEIKMVKFTCGICGKPQISPVFEILEDTAMHYIYLCACPVCEVDHRILVYKYTGISKEDDLPTQASAYSPNKKPPI